MDDGGNRSLDGISGTYSTSADATGPTIVSVEATAVNVVQIEFQEDVEQASVENALNYTIEPGITIFSASLQSDLRTVELATSAHVVGANYTVYISNVRDRATVPNTISSGSNGTYTGFAGELNISITGDDGYTLFVNGDQIGSGNTWFVAQEYTVPSIAGKNVIAVKCEDMSDKGGFLAEIDFNGMLYVTDESWRVSITEETNWNTVEYNDLAWPKASNFGLHGVAMPWAQYNDVSGISTDNGAKWIWSSDQQNHNTVYFRLVLNTGGDITPPNPPQNVSVSSQ